MTRSEQTLALDIIRLVRDERADIRGFLLGLKGDPEGIEGPRALLGAIKVLRMLHVSHDIDWDAVTERILLDPGRPLID